MPCGSRARITAYVVYQSLAFAERDVLLAALADAGYSSVESADVGTENTNPLSVAGPNGRTNATAAIVIRAPSLPAGFGDLGFMVYEGAYVPVVPAEARADRILKTLRTNYGRAKAAQLAEHARHRYHAAVHRTTAADGTLTVRVRF